MEVVVCVNMDMWFMCVFIFFDDLDLGLDLRFMVYFVKREREMWIKFIFLFLKNGRYYKDMVLSCF